MSDRKRSASEAALKRAEKHPLGSDRTPEELVLYELCKEDFAELRVSDVIRHVDQLRREAPDLRAVVYMRESTWKQKKRSNLRNRSTFLRRSLHRMGIRILDCYEEVASGTRLRELRVLPAAIKAAGQRQAGNPNAVVIVVTDARNRFVRGAHYNGQEQTDPPYVWQLEELKDLAGDVTLATLLPPDEPFGEVRAYETKVAGESGKQYGRPRSKAKSVPGEKKKRRERLKPLAMKLRRRGESIRAIAKRLKAPVMTVAGWLKPIA